MCTFILSYLDSFSLLLFCFPVCIFQFNFKHFLAAYYVPSTSNVAVKFETLLG